MMPPEIDDWCGDAVRRRRHRSATDPVDPMPVVGTGGWLDRRRRRGRRRARRRHVPVRRAAPRCVFSEIRHVGGAVAAGDSGAHRRWATATGRFLLQLTRHCRRAGRRRGRARRHQRTDEGRARCASLGPHVPQLPDGDERRRLRADGPRRRRPAGHRRDVRPRRSRRPPALRRRPRRLSAPRQRRRAMSGVGRPLIALRTPVAAASATARRGWKPDVWSKRAAISTSRVARLPKWRYTAWRVTPALAPTAASVRPVHAVVGDLTPRRVEQPLAGRWVWHPTSHRRGT